MLSDNWLDDIKKAVKGSTSERLRVYINPKLGITPDKAAGPKYPIIDGIMENHYIRH